MKTLPLPRLRSVHWFNYLAITCAFTVVVLLSPIASAQTGGTVLGRVSNAATSAYLDGAAVTLAPGNLSAFTSSTGEFVIPNVPPGTYSLTAAYTGLDAKTVQVSVGAGTTASQDIQLTSSIYQLDK